MEIDFFDDANYVSYPETRPKPMFQIDPLLKEDGHRMPENAGKPALTAEEY